jgi:hypothetical protein
LIKFNELPSEKANLKRMGSRTSGNVNQSIVPAENEWIPEEFLAEFARQKVYYFS